MKLYFELGNRSFLLMLNTYDIARDVRAIFKCEVSRWKPQEKKRNTRSWNLSRGSYGDHSFVHWHTMKDGKLGGWEISGPLVKIHSTSRT